ncbi:hypothetical protein SRHO_G00341880 [Serrasalmus rhombeus]
MSLRGNSDEAVELERTHSSSSSFKFNVEHGAKTAYLLFCVQWSWREEQHGVLDVGPWAKPEPERSSSPGSNSDVPPSQLKATSEITPGSADDMCLSSRPLERPVVVQVHSDSHLQRQSVFGRLLHVLRREQGLQRTQQASWMDTASSQMLRCLAELQQARLSSSKKQKKQLLRALKSCLSARCPAFDGYDQEDAHEFLMLILLQLKEEGEALRTSCVSSICPVEHFEFQLKSVRTCTSCGLQVSRVEDFNHLSINLRSTLAHSLHAYFQPTDIEISCECEQGCRASEVQEFSTLPRVLILHVMRFDMLDYGEKLKDRMDIPAQLDLSDFPGVASLGKQSSGSTSFQASPRSSLRPGVSTHRPLQTAWCCVSFGEQLGQRPLHQ